MANNSFLVNKSATFTPQLSIPSSPVSGDMYYDSTQKTFILYNNGSWINIASQVDVASAASLTSSQFTSTIVQNPLIRITGSTATAVSGLTASTPGHLVVLYNVSSAAVTINNNSITESTAANRILTPGGGAILVSSGSAISLMYDSSQSRWIIASSSGTAVVPNSTNTLINSNFDFWQRGTSFSGTGYSADRWLIGGGSAIATNQIPFTVGQTAVPNNPTFYLEITPTGGSPTNANLIQNIENVQSFSGESVTVTFWAQGTHLVSSEISVNIFQNFGSGGSSQVSVALPSISCKTIGSSSNISLEFVATINNGGLGGGVDYAQIMLGQGASASPWAYASGGTTLNTEAELAMCQRYYEKSYNINITPGTAVTGGPHPGTAYYSNTTSVTLLFKTTKRISPTVVTYDTLGASGKLSLLANGVITSGITQTIDYVNTYSAQFTGSPTITNGFAAFYYGNWTADAEF